MVRQLGEVSWSDVGKQIVLDITGSGVNLFAPAGGTAPAASGEPVVEKKEDNTTAWLVGGGIALALVVGFVAFGGRK